MNGRVLGVDGCRGGWVGIAWGADGSVVAYARSRISELVEAAEADGSVDVIAVDIPIGLPERGRRKADAQARLALGARRSGHEQPRDGYRPRPRRRRQVQIGHG